MRVGVIGAGAVGGLIAAELARHGVEVVVWARGASVDVIRTEGIEVSYEGQPSFTARVAEVARFPELPQHPVDLAVLCVKSYDNADLLRTIPSFLAESGRVLCVQNGVVNEELLAAVVGADRVLSGVLYVGVGRSGPGKVVCSTPARVQVGPYGEASPDSAADVVALFDGTGVTARVEPQIATAKWGKFLFNCGLNPLTALTRRTLGAIIATTEGAELFGTLVDEAIAVARARKAPIAEDAAERTWATARRMDITSSMAEDLEAHRRLEVELFTGYVCELGDSLGVPTPTSRIVRGLLTAADSTRSPA